MKNQAKRCFWCKNRWQVTWKPHKYFFCPNAHMQQQHSIIFRNCNSGHWKCLV